MRQAGHGTLAKAPRRAPSRTQTFQLSNWTGLQQDTQPHPASSPGLDLHLDDADDGVEQIVVYGKRRSHAEENWASGDAPISFGPATITGGEVREGSFSGARATASVPVAGIQGLDATLNLSGGYDQVNASTTAASAAITAGLRLRF